MKKIFLAGAIALFGLANAQVNYGVKAGYSLSNAHFKDVSEQPDNKSGVYAGTFVEYKVNKNFSVQGELLYSNTGFKKSDKHEYNYLRDSEMKMEDTNFPVTSYDVTNIYSVNLHTLMVPVSAKYYVMKELAVMGGANLGWVFSGVIKTEQQYGSKENSLQRQNTTSLNDKLNQFSVAPFVGLSYNFTDNCFMEAKYNHGVTEIFKAEQGALKGNVRFFEIGVGYQF